MIVEKYQLCILSNCYQYIHISIDFRTRTLTKSFNGYFSVFNVKVCDNTPFVGQVEEHSYNVDIAVIRVFGRIMQVFTIAGENYFFPYLHLVLRLS